MLYLIAPTIRIARGAIKCQIRYIMLSSVFLCSPLSLLINALG